MEDGETETSEDNYQMQKKQRPEQIITSTTDESMAQDNSQVLAPMSDCHQQFLNTYELS